MKRYYILPLILSVVLVTACGNNQKKKGDNKAEAQNDTTATENPLMSESNLPYGVPNFDKISTEDYKPAIVAGIEKKKKEIKKIANNPEAPTFENTFVALEKSGQDLQRALLPFFLMTSANTNDTLQEVQEEMAPKLASLSDFVFLNDKLFKRVKTIYDQREELNLKPEALRLVEYYYEQFTLRGANLSDEKKEQLRDINKKLASLGSKFSQKILASFTKSALVVDSKEDLAGLSEAAIKSAAEYADGHGHEGKYEIPLVNTTQQPALASLENREIRKKLFMNSINRAEKGDEQDTRDIVLEMAKLRADKAKLLGYDSYAEWNLQDQMAKSPEAVQELLGKIVPAATKKAKAEAAALQEVIEKSGKDFELEPWDWNFYAEKLRKAKYELDEDVIKQYFVLDSVLKNGIFYAAHKLYGITFEERHDIPVYNDDVRVFELKEEDGTTIGLFYCDYFKRDNKRGGAWMSNIRIQSGLMNQKPVIYNVCNYQKPAEGEPALLSFDNVSTMFHEFGHALHGFFASQEYPTLSGTSVPRDFVEFPSQINEYWAVYPDVLKNYAKHYKTGEVIPQQLIDKIKKASTFNQGYMMSELLESAQLDMQWHMIAADEDVTDVDQFEEQALKSTGLYLENVPPRYRSSYFSHIWSGGYAAGYYAYIWTNVLSADAHSWFEENGGMTRENGQRFREMILSIGNTKNLSNAFKEFRGHAPDITPMLEDIGLVQK